MSSGTALLIAVFLLLGNAFFVGSEFALISARRTQIEPRAREGSRVARVTLKAMEQVSLMLAGAQLGITMCSLGLGAIGEPALAHLIEEPFLAAGLPESVIHPAAFGVALVIVIFLHMVVGEMVPKNLALVEPTRSALFLGPILYAIVGFLRLPIRLLNLISNTLVRLLGVEPKDEVVSAFTREEVASLIAESRREGLLDESEHKLLRGALTLKQRTVKAVLIPAARLETVSSGVSASELEARAAATGFSRFPVIDGDPEPIGYLHLKDVLEEEPARRRRPTDAGQIRSMPTLGIDEPLDSALRKMQAEGNHLALVLGPEGGYVGVAALEDVLEELVGVIRDANQLRNRG